MGLLEDRRVLNNAVEFTTEQRAYEAAKVYNAPLEEYPPKSRAFEAVEAFKHQMTATEDSLAWLLALSRWRPGKAQTSLTVTLKAVHFGGGQAEEDKRLAFLETLDLESFRKVLHLASAEEHAAAGISEEAVAAIELALPAQIEGFRRIAALRREEDGTRVAAFGTLKHINTAMFLAEEGALTVFVPARVRFQGDTLRLATLSLSTESDVIRELASSALTMQAALHSMLAAVRWVRFGIPYSTPAWAAATLDLKTWRMAS